MMLGMLSCKRLTLGRLQQPLQKIGQRTRTALSPLGTEFAQNTSRLIKGRNIDDGLVHGGVNQILVAHPAHIDGLS